MKNMVRLNKFVFVLICILISLSSCDNLIKKGTKELTEEQTQKIAKVFGKKGLREFEEKAVRESGERAIRNLNWHDVLNFLKKENPQIAEEIIEKFGKTQRKAVLSAMADDPAFLNKVIRIPSFFDRYTVFINGIDELAFNTNVMKMVANSIDLAKRSNFLKNPLTNIAIKESDGIVHFINKKTGDILGDYVDGVMTLKKNIVRMP